MIKIDFSSSRSLKKSISELNALKSRLERANKSLKGIRKEVYERYEKPLIRSIQERPIDQDDDRWKGFVMRKIGKNPLIKGKSILERIREIDLDAEDLTQSGNAKRIRSQIRINGMAIRKSEIQKVVKRESRKVNVSSWKSVMFEIDEAQAKMLNYIRKEIKKTVKSALR